MKSSNAKLLAVLIITAIVFFALITLFGKP